MSVRVTAGFWAEDINVCLGGFKRPNVEGGYIVRLAGGIVAYLTVAEIERFADDLSRLAAQIRTSEVTP